MKKVICAFCLVIMLAAMSCTGFAEVDAKYQPGNYVTFGTYPQGANGEVEPIEWLVLEVQDGKALLISRYGLDAKPYNTENEDVTWETCTLRAWLNSEFLNTAFSSDEQDAILLTDVDNSSSQCYSGWDTIGGNNTQDKVFLLSYAEANKYFDGQYYKINGAKNNFKSRVAPTEYAIQLGANVYSEYRTSDGKKAGMWWLRSPGFYVNSMAAYININGSIGSIIVDFNTGVVCPVLWLKLE